MNKIDVSKCEFLIISNDKYLCHCIKSDLFGGIEFVENAKSVTCKDNPNCYYKQLQELKAENKKYKKLIDEIEEIATAGHEGFCPKCSKKDCEDNDCHETAIIDILDKIKEVKE